MLKNLTSLSNFRKHRVATIDLQYHQSHLAIAGSEKNSNGYDYVVLEKLFCFEETQELKDIFSTQNVSMTSYVATSTEALVEVCECVSPSSVASYKRNYGIGDGQTFDYFNFRDGAMICALPLELAQQTSSVLAELHKGTNTINQSDVILAYFYHRTYSNTDTIRTAILNFSNDHVSLIIMNKGIPNFVGSLSIKIGETDSFATADMLFAEALKVSTENSNYDLLLLVGECDESFLTNLRVNFASSNINVGSIEFFNPLAYSFINIDNLPSRDQEVLRREGHRFVTVLGGVAINLEYGGVDLSTHPQSLAKTLTSEVCFYTPENYALKIFDFTIQTVKTVKHAVARQTTILVIAILISLLLTSYNYYQTNQQLISLETRTTSEKKKLESLKDVKLRYQEYQTKLQVKNDRVKAIQEIQITQLVVPTITKLFHDAKYPLRDFMQFQTLEISGRNVQLQGKSIDKAQTIEFLRNLSNTGAFIDLNPTYDSTDSVNCRYSVTTNYTGPVRGNPIVLPISSPTEVAQFNNTGVNSNTKTSINTPSTNSISK